MKNTLGWGGFGSTSREDGPVVPGSTWEHELRPSKDPAPLSPLDSVIGQVNHLKSSPVIKMSASEIKRYLIKGVRSRADTPESRRTGDKLEDEVCV